MRADPRRIRPHHPFPTMKLPSSGRRLPLRIRLPMVGLALLSAFACEASGREMPGREAPEADGRLWLFGPDSSQVFTPATTAADLVRRFGAQNVRDGEIELGEGDAAQGTLLYPDDPMRRVEIVWHDAAGRTRPELVRISGDSSAWVVAPEIRIGTTLAELERLNGGPFTVSLFAMDNGSTVTDWRGGRLARLSQGQPHVQLWMMPATPADTTLGAESMEGEESVYPSDSPELRRLQPRIAEITLWFPADPESMADEAPANPDSSGDGAGLDPAQVPGLGANVQAFVPAGWRLAADAEGDLDGDGRADHVLHLVPEGTHYDPAGVTAAPEAHALLIVVADEAGFRRAGLARGLLQPFVPQYGLELTVQDGTLTVNQNYGMSQVTDLTHRFRYDRPAGRFRLVGKETFHYTRPLSRDNTVRVVDDYEAGERVTITGHVRDGVVAKETTRRERIPPARIYFDHVDEIIPDEEEAGGD